MDKQEQELPESPESPESLVERIEQLANMLQDSSVGELELGEKGTEIILRRSGSGSPSVPATQTFPVPNPAPQESSVLQDQVTKLPSPPTSVEVIAPLTGVVYLAPSPDQPPFVRVGDNVQPEQLVALIETMKVFNDIRVEVGGKIIQLVAKSGEVVKKGNVLFRIEPV